MGWYLKLAQNSQEQIEERRNTPLVLWQIGDGQPIPQLRLVQKTVKNQRHQVRLADASRSHEKHTMLAKPSRTTGWSSAIKTRMGLGTLMMSILTNYAGAPEPPRLIEFLARALWRFRSLHQCAQPAAAYW